MCKIENKHAEMSRLRGGSQLRERKVWNIGIELCGRAKKKGQEWLDSGLGVWPCAVGLGVGEM